MYVLYAVNGKKTENLYSCSHYILLSFLKLHFFVPSFSIQFQYILIYDFYRNLRN